MFYNDENLKNSNCPLSIIVDVLFKFKIGLLCSMCSSVCALKKSNNEVDGFAIFPADKASSKRRDFSFKMIRAAEPASASRHIKSQIS